MKPSPKFGPHVRYFPDGYGTRRMTTNIVDRDDLSSRYFAFEQPFQPGLTVPEIGQLIEYSLRPAEQNGTYARTSLYAERKDRDN